MPHILGLHNLDISAVFLLRTRPQRGISGKESRWVPRLSHRDQDDRRVACYLDCLGGTSK